MRIVFFHSDKPREESLAQMFVAGANNSGHNAMMCSLGSGIPVGTQVACMVGVKSTDLWKECRDLNIRLMMFDKGYSRHKTGGTWEYWRMSLDAHHPTRTTLTSFKYPSDRFEGMNVEVRPWTQGGHHILILGSSEKYHNFHGIEHPNKFAKRLIDRIKKLTDRPVVYRPKPSWKGALPMPDSIYSDGKQPLADVLSGCRVAVTHGSNGCFEAAVAGIPSLVLGDGVMAPISSTCLEDIEHVYKGDRQPIFNALAYHQWTIFEMASGEAFKTINKWLGDSI